MISAMSLLWTVALLSITSSMGLLSLILILHLWGNRQLFVSISDPDEPTSIQEIHSELIIHLLRRVTRGLTLLNQVLINLQESLERADQSESSGQDQPPLPDRSQTTTRPLMSLQTLLPPGLTLRPPLFPPRTDSPVIPSLNSSQMARRTNPFTQSQRDRHDAFIDRILSRTAPSSPAPSLATHSEHTHSETIPVIKRESPEPELPPSDNEELTILTKKP